MHSGFVSIIGRPNVGKSTLLNSLLNFKVAITSNKAQTTRNVIQGIYNEENYQIVFLLLMLVKVLVKVTDLSWKL